MTKKPKKSPKENKFNKYTVFLGTFVLIVILMLVVYYSGFIQISEEPELYEETLTTSITTEQETFVKEGFCERDSHCFITYCRGSETDCVNTTQLSDYSKNCKTYSDWIVEMQDYSRCACIKNSCSVIE